MFGTSPDARRWHVHVHMILPQISFGLPAIHQFQASLFFRRCRKLEALCVQLSIPALPRSRRMPFQLEGMPRLRSLALYDISDIMPSILGLTQLTHLALCDTVWNSMNR